MLRASSKLNTSGWGRIKEKRESTSQVFNDYMSAASAWRYYQADSRPDVRYVQPSGRILWLFSHARKTSVCQEAWLGKRWMNNCTVILLYVGAGRLRSEGNVSEAWQKNPPTNDAKHTRKSTSEWHNKNLNEDFVDGKLRCLLHARCCSEKSSKLIQQRKVCQNPSTAI